MTNIMKSMKFDDILKNQVDMEKVDLESVKPWISKRLTGIMKQEDEVLIEYICNQLEPKFPNPREIQTNLSGFLSIKNARIFIAELWKELLDSMSLVGNGKNDKKITSDKIKSFPRLGPSENKFSSFSVFNRSKSKEKNAIYQKKDDHSRHSSSRSSSTSLYNNRARSRSTSQYTYRNRYRYRYRSRSQTKSSSRYTPYTRYSRYTESYKSSSVSHSSVVDGHDNKRFSNSSPVSSDSHSEISIDINNQMTRNAMMNESYRSESSNQNSPSISEKNDYKSNKELLDDSQRSPKKSTSSLENWSPNTFCNQSSPNSSSSSGSIAFVSPGHIHLRQMNSVSDSSSSEYSIEYTDKTVNRCLSEDELGSDVEWITKEEYERLKGSNSPCHSSLISSPSNSFSSSDFSCQEIIWVDKNQLDQISDDYFICIN